MSVLDFKGKNATAGLPCIFQLLTGQFFYSETVKEDSDSWVFDGDKTLVLIISKGKAGTADLKFIKISQSEFQPKQLRVPKTSILMITDCGIPELIQKAREALSGIVLPGGTVN
jgi:hypothetical protein